MFTGIINNVTKADKIVRNSDSMEIIFPTPEGWNLEEGDSVNIDGVCSTATEVGTTFKIFYMEETLKKSTLSSLDEDHKFNLERPLTPQDLINGHIVQGHVDTTASVEDIRHDGDVVEFKFSLPKEFTKYIIYKGSISINGISLTVTAVDDSSFSVALIPHTLENTNFSELKVGDPVNIEVDLISKYIEKLINKEA